MSRPRFERFLQNLAHWCTYHNLPWYWYWFRGRVRSGGKGRFWCAACKSVSRACSTSTLLFISSNRKYPVGKAAKGLNSSNDLVCMMIDSVILTEHQFGTGGQTQIYKGSQHISVYEVGMLISFNNPTLKTYTILSDDKHLYLYVYIFSLGIVTWRDTGHIESTYNFAAYD